MVELFEQRAEELHPALGRLGPDLSKDHVDTEEILRRLRGPGREDLPIAVALLNQRVLAGIGHEMKNEVLWLARVSPWKPVRDVGGELLGVLVGPARDVLREGAATGRRPRRVYGRAARPCPRCGTMIRVEHPDRDLPRLTFWCPSCQPLS